MYCKYCGKEITDDSLYCNLCGKRQKSKCLSCISLIEKYKKNIILYAIWVSFHFVLFLFGNKDLEEGGDAKSQFFPFTKNFYLSFDVDYYDITEFTVYIVLIPLIWESIKLLFRTKLPLLYQKIVLYKIYICLCVIWLIVHCVLLFSYTFYDAKQYFFPFDRYYKHHSFFNVGYYDITEFVVYCVLLPLLVYFFIIFWKRKK